MEPSARNHLARVYSLEALGSVGGNLLMLGIFFYTQKRFGWGARKNLLLSSTQGMVYVIGALAAHPISARIGRIGLLRVLHAAMAAAALAGLFAPGATSIVTVLLIYTLLSAAQWPLLESLISARASPRMLSRRISIYNLVWSGSGAITVALCGVIIVNYAQGIFLCALAASVISLMLLFFERPAPAQLHAGHLRPEPELLPQRTLAMRLSRVALPATFAVLYALGALMPTLPVIRGFAPELRTLIASIWMIARWFCFLMLGATSWWHTRPRALLAAAVVLSLAFLGITLMDSPIGMILWQIALGAAMGLIYSASLYFGMVLSDGSTTQSAYHEALIGLGCILGPGSGALADFIRPGDPNAGIIAVAVVLWISVLLAAVVSVQSRRVR
jgi:MFS family permease